MLAPKGDRECATSHILGVAPTSHRTVIALLIEEMSRRFLASGDYENVEVMPGLMVLSALGVLD